MHWALGIIAVQQCWETAVLVNLTTRKQDDCSHRQGYSQLGRESNMHWALGTVAVHKCWDTAVLQNLTGVYAATGKDDPSFCDRSVVQQAACAQGLRGIVVLW